MLPHLSLAEISPRNSDVCFGSKADICTAKRYVRFAPESGHMQRSSRCLLWANSGHDLWLDAFQFARRRATTLPLADSVDQLPFLFDPGRKTHPIMRRTASRANDGNWDVRQCFQNDHIAI